MAPAALPPVGSAIYAPGPCQGRPAPRRPAAWSFIPEPPSPPWAMGHHGARGIRALAGPQLEHESYQVEFGNSREGLGPSHSDKYIPWAAGTELASGNLPPSELTRRTGAVGETLSGCHGSADSARGAIPLATGRARQAHAIEAAERGAWHPKH